MFDKIRGESVRGVLGLGVSLKVWCNGDLWSIVR